MTFKVFISTNWNSLREAVHHYPTILYKAGRKKALQHFLENKTIFQTDEFINKFEVQARENITKEIELLSQ